MAKYFVLEAADAEQIISNEAIRESICDHNPDRTIYLCEATICVALAQKNGVYYLVKGRKAITQAQREAYLREWYPIDDDNFDI